MKRLKKRATLVLCAVLAASFAGSAMARPYKAAQPPQAATQPQDTRSADGQPYPFANGQASAANPAKAGGRGRGSHTGDAFGGSTTNSLVSEARSYLAGC